MSLGAFLAIWGRQTLAENWSGKTVLQVDHKLVTHGPYSFTKHPIYVGGYASFVGCILIAGGINLVGLLCSILILWGMVQKAKEEERLLKTRFPKE